MRLINSRNAFAAPPSRSSRSPPSLPLSRARRQEVGGSLWSSDLVPEGLRPLLIQVFLQIRVLPLGSRGAGAKRTATRRAPSQMLTNMLGPGREFHLLSKFPFGVGFDCWLPAPPRPPFLFFLSSLESATQSPAKQMGRRGIDAPPRRPSGPFASSQAGPALQTQGLLALFPVPAPTAPPGTECRPLAG